MFTLWVDFDEDFPLKCFVLPSTSLLGKLVSRFSEEKSKKQERKIDQRKVISRNRGGRARTVWQKFDQLCSIKKAWEQVSCASAVKPGYQARGRFKMAGETNLRARCFSWEKQRRHANFRRLQERGRKDMAAKTISFSGRGVSFSWCDVNYTGITICK